MSSGVWLGFIDRDVLLARNGGALSMTNVSKSTYAAELTIPSQFGTAALTANSSRRSIRSETRPTGYAEAA